MAILQLQTLTGCAKGLTRTSDVLFAFDDNAQDKAEFERLQRARDEPRMVRLREAIMEGVRGVMALWSGDATTADVGLVAFTQTESYLITLNSDRL